MGHAWHGITHMGVIDQLPLRIRCERMSHCELETGRDLTCSDTFFFFF